jgi:hypothetical protein
VCEHVRFFSVLYLRRWRRWECYLPTYLATGESIELAIPPRHSPKPPRSATTAVRTAVASSTRRLKIVSAQPVADATQLEAT